MLRNKLSSRQFYGILLIFITIYYGCSEPRIQNKDWPNYLGGVKMSHYSELTQINKDNVNSLEIAWQYHTRDSGNFQCNPIIVHGVLFGISPANNVFALDASTGDELWRFNPSETKAFMTNRGVAYWSNEKESRILFSYQEWIYALDAKTGKSIQSFGDQGRISMRSGLGDNAVGKYLVSRTPGTIFENLIIMPTVMIEEPGSAPGFLQAFNVITGELEWVFHTIPLPGEFGFDTWPADVHVKGVVGGANNWSGISLDEERGIVYVPTGSAGPDYYGGSRVGENLFANTILAIDARSGKRIWHFKVVKHDIWDRDLPAPTNITTINRNGESIDVVAQVTKSGHVFVLDQDDGSPIYPVEEVAVPASTVEGEEAWPTQTLPKIPLPFTSQEITEDDLNHLSPDYDSLLALFRSYEKGLFKPFSGTPTLINPGLNGGAEWGGAAVDPNGILYVNANEVPWVVTLKENPKETELRLGALTYVNNCSSCHGVERRGNPASGFPELVQITAKLSKSEIENTVFNGKGMMPGFSHLSGSEKTALMNYLLDEDVEKNNPSKKLLYENTDPWGIERHVKFLDGERNPGKKPPWGTLTAIDLNTGNHKWQVTLGENKKYKEAYGISTGTENYGGPIVTGSGLLFIAATSDSKIRAYDTETGALLWEGKLPVSGFATPSTYMVDGVQYVVIACGGARQGEPRRDFVVAFKLSDK